MKFVNPFARQKKVDGVPYSVFPCGKITRTDLKIGRAVPVYTLEMVQGNHVNLDLSELCRFMSTDKPVMNDFEVNFGAFFVPYVALDALSGNSLEFRKMLPNPQMCNDNICLSARTFFNPATPDNQRVHPMMVDARVMGNNPLVGSLADYLGYYCFNDVQSKVQIWKKSGSSTTDGPHYEIADLCSVNSRWSNYDSAHTSEYDSVLIKNTAPKRGAMPFDVYLTLRFAMGVDPFAYEGGFDGIPFEDFHDISYNRLSSIFPDPTLSEADFKKLVFGVHAVFFGSTTVTTNKTYKELFGGLTTEQVMDEWIGAVRAYYIRNNISAYNTFKASSLRWLVYHRIYGDYFLNEYFVERNDFFNAIAALYQWCGSGSTPLSAAWSGVKTDLSISPWVSWFFDNYITKVQTLPVMWQKDYFTALMNPQQQNNAVVIEANTTVPALFEKRMLQKFRDLINRLDKDYRSSASALYGSQIPDNTLQRSVCVGRYTAPVTISAIAQTSEQKEGGSPVGTFSGFGYSNTRKSHFVDWTAEENGMLMILAWVRPTGVAFTTAVDRDIIKHEYLDYLIPQFGGVGYQDVKVSQLCPRQTSNAVLGIQEKYFEYMRKENSVHGAFKTYAQNYSVDRTVLPSIAPLTKQYSPSFLYITDADDVQRVFVDSIGSPILASIGFEGSVTRQLPATIRTDF